MKKIDLGHPPSFFYAPRWSPDSKKIVLSDKRLNLWLVDIEQPDAGEDRHRPLRGRASFDTSWSPDSRWLAYEKQLANHLHAIFVYSLAGQEGRAQVTDGAQRRELAALRSRAASTSGSSRSTDVGLAGDGGMTSMGRPVTSSVYAAVLQKDRLPGGSRERRGGAAPGTRTARATRRKTRTDKKDDKAAKATTRTDKADKPAEPVKIDFDGIDQRIVALPDRARELRRPRGRRPKASCSCVRAPMAFTDEDYVEFDDEEPPPLDVSASTSKTRKAEKFIDKIDYGRRWRGRSSSRPTARRCSTRKDKKWFLVGRRQGAQGRRRRHEAPTASRSGSIRAPSGGRSTTRSGASSATSSTTRTRTASTSPRPRSSTRRSSTASPGRDDLNALFEEMLGQPRARPRLVVGGGAIPRQEHVERRAARRGLPRRGRAAIASRRILVGRELEPEAPRSAHPARAST